MNLSTWCSFLLAVTFFKMFIDIHSSLYLILNIEIGNQKRFPFREGNKFNFKCFHLCYLDWQARVLFSRWICAQVDVRFHFLWPSYHSGQLNIVLVENSTIQTIRKWILTNGVNFCRALIFREINVFFCRSTLEIALSGFNDMLLQKQQI